ncbi:FMN-binding protein MioC [Neptunicella marina]|uniref:FMN-binding protein MioC n=1 Tax=Neptunicella marina TaxID=2125989 RepID=A0A8J6ISH4_9ALTE|nr:FMN-binding protein MioC [Neptunicella marina]MBC3766645.1 FMN-binding protein MioC [Neptunicella marina]
MMQVEIIVGSMLGASEYVADAIEEQLAESEVKSKIHLQPDLNDISSENLWIICTSTHGAGDLPDNIQQFYEQLQNANLEGIKYLLIGLGDTSYDTFCQGAKTVDDILQKQGAMQLAEPLFIDVLAHPIPETVACQWLAQQISQHNVLANIVQV